MTFVVIIDRLHGYEMTTLEAIQVSYRGRVPQKQPNGVHSYDIHGHRHLIDRKQEII